MEFQMRNKTFISSMVGVAAAVAVAGSANAGVVDPFTTNQSFGNDSSSGFVSITGGLFNERNAFRSASAGGAGVRASSNDVAFTTNRANFGLVGLTYQMAGGSSNDLSLITGMSIALSALNLSNGATGVSFYWQAIDVNSNSMYASQNLSSNGTSTFDFAAATKDVGFDLTNVTTLQLSVTQIGGPTSGSTISVSGTLSNFSYTAVPAPGALALLGVAGLVGARRRRD
jgi:MYXO-CTERM domain-containing protein